MGLGKTIDRADYSSAIIAGARATGAHRGTRLAGSPVAGGNAQRRFNLSFSIFNEQRFEVASDETGEQVLDVNPWHEEQLVLCSLSFLINNPRLAKMAEDGDWDLLVVDEAHHLAWSVAAVSPNTG